MVKNPFAKSRKPGEAPYAIYRAGDMVWHVAKTYKLPASEARDPYARWFVWASGPGTFGKFEGGDTYAAEVKRYGTIVAAEPAWLEAYGIHLKVPTPSEYLWLEAK